MRWSLLPLLLATACAYPTAPTTPPPVTTVTTPVLSSTTTAPPTTHPLSLNLIVGPASPTVGAAAAFTALSAASTPQSPTSYAWDFGDGIKRTTAGDTTFYTYTRAGTFQGSVSLTDGQGRTANATTVVVVTAAPSSSSSSSSSTTPSTVPVMAITLTCTAATHGTASPCNVSAMLDNDSLTSDINRVDWDWGDGQIETVVTGNSPYGPTPLARHTYAQAGKYTVVADVTAKNPATSGSAIGTTTTTLTIP